MAMIRACIGMPFHSAAASAKLAASTFHGREWKRMPRLWRQLGFFMRRLLRATLRSRHSPRQIAGGVAVGVFVGFTPTMGCQMITAGLVSTFLRLSRIPAVTFVYITNPVTAAPIYGASYFLGALILRPFGFRPINFARIRNLFMDREGLGFWEDIATRLGELFALSGETFAALWIGCLIAGAVAAAVSYYVTLRFVTGHRLLRAERQARRAQRRLERIRMEQELAKARRPGEDPDA